MSKACILSIFLLALAGTAIGCGGGDETGTASQQPGAEAQGAAPADQVPGWDDPAARPEGAAEAAGENPAQPAAEAGAPGNTPALSGEAGEAMAARVNGTVITRAEVEKKTGELLQQLQNRVPPNQLGQMRGQVQEQAVQNLVDQKLLLEEAGRKGIQPEKQTVDQRYNEISGRAPSPEEFKKAIASMGFTEETVRQEIERGLKIETLIEREVPTGAGPTAEEVEAFYRNHPQDFQVPEQVRASHILFTLKPEDKAERREERRQELVRLRGEIEKGADFAQLASQHSDCPSKSQGGDLGLFGRGRMVPPFEEAAFRLKTGEVSDVVETQFGYHLIKVTEHQTPSTMPLDQVKGDLEAYLKNQKQEVAIRGYLSGLRGRARIEYAAAYQPAPAAPPGGPNQSPGAGATP